MTHLVCTLGAIVACIGLCGVVGYASDIESLYRWGQNPMAPQVAVAFAMEGIGLFLLGWHSRHEGVR